jgi:hypothetical protein
MFWQIPTVGCEVTREGLNRKPHPLENPTIPFEEIISIYNTVPQRIFEAEILSTFLEGEGAVFRNINACLHAPRHHPGAALRPPHHSRPDWAKQQDHLTTTRMRRLPAEVATTGLTRLIITFSVTG